MGGHSGLDKIKCRTMVRVVAHTGGILKAGRRRRFAGRRELGRVLPLNRWRGVGEVYGYQVRDDPPFAHAFEGAVKSSDEASCSNRTRARKPPAIVA